jgi:predicted SprT family Zn-dependent metalloprotease
MNLDQIQELVAYSLNEFNLNDKVQVEFSNKMTKALGRCTYSRLTGQTTIKISTKLWERANDSERENTVIHESAHAVQFIQTGSSDHGDKWKDIHTKIGGTPNQYHCVDRTGLVRKVERHQFTCGCTIHTLTQTMATRRYNRYRCYGICRKCRKQIFPMYQHSEDVIKAAAFRAKGY